MLCKTTSKEFEFFHKSCTTAVAMATMTFQNGGYFRKIQYVIPAPRKFPMRSPTFLAGLEIPLPANRNTSKQVQRKQADTVNVMATASLHTNDGFIWGKAGGGGGGNIFSYNVRIELILLFV